MSTMTSAADDPRMIDGRSGDAYERWLHAQARQIALNAYELLGITPLDNNLNRIRAMIERQQHEVEKHEATAAPELWSAFSREFSAAADVLLHTERKELLDATIRRQRAAEENRRLSDDGAGPAAAVGNALLVPCGACAHPNARERKFCASCGTALWDVCPKCRAAKLASERFCGACGVDCVNHVAQQASHFDEQLALAARLQAEARFADARHIVRQMARLEDPRFEAHAHRAARLLDEFAVGQKQLEAQVEQNVALAEQLLRQHAYHTALETLASVPEPLRNEAFQRVHAEASERQRESEQLLAAIRAGIEQKQNITLLPVVERFLALKPNHAQATKLARQLVEQVFAQATRLTNADDWEGAMSLLSRVPESAVTEPMKKLRDECDERTWLAHEVRSNSVLHPALPGLADRLVELCPKREEFITAAKQLKQRTAMAPKHPWQAVPDWRAAPQRTSVGLPVDWWGGLTRVTLADDKLLGGGRTGLGRWSIAIGLALQAVGQGALDVNFTESEKGGMLSRLTGSFRKRGPQLGWGIDLSDSSLKAVLVRWDETTQTARIEAAELQEADAEGSDSTEGAREAWPAAALKKFASTHDLTGTKLAVNLPAQVCLARFCQVPMAKGKKFVDLVNYEAKQQFPIALDDLWWEYVEVRDTDAEKGSEPATMARVMLLAARKTIVQARLDLFQQANLKPDIVQCDAVALHQFLRFELHNASGDDTLADPNALVAALDIGAESSTFLVSGCDFLWFRTFAAAGDEFTKVMVRELKLVRRQAEQGKRQLHRVRKAARVVELWGPIQEQIRNECQRSLTQWKSLHAGGPPQRLLCLGGGAQTYGLVETLRGSG